MKMIDGVVSIVYTDGVNVEIEHKELVMCKNCVHYDDGLCRKWIYAHVTREDSFCSDAEREEE